MNDQQLIQEIADLRAQLSAESEAERKRIRDKVNATPHLADDVYLRSIIECTAPAYFAAQGEKEKE